MIKSNKVRRKALSIALSLCMVISMMPTAFAATATDFKDVSSTEWYYNSVEYVTDKGYFSGITNDTFAPTAPMTRAMFVTVLARADGATINNNVSPFDDVKSGEWYAGAVSWAVENKIVSGVGDNKFAPDQNVTRQDMATLMARYIEYYTAKNKVTFEKNGTSKTFTDADKIAAYAKDAVALCVSYGLIDGYTDGSFAPEGVSTRAQVAAVVQRLSKTVETGKAVEEPVPVPEEPKDDQNTSGNTSSGGSKNKTSDVSASTAADFEAAAEVARATVTATIEEENSLTVNDDITIDNKKVSTLTLNLGNAKLGDVTINAGSAKTILINTDENNAASVQSLTINAPYASVTNNVVVNGSVTIKAVSENTFNSCAEIKGIIYFDGPGAIAFETPSGSSSDISAPEIVINTQKPVILKENSIENITPQVKVVADNADLTVATPAKVESTAATAKVKVNTAQQVEISGKVDTVTAITQTPNLKVEGTVESIVAQEATTITINGAGSISSMNTGAAAVTVEAGETAIDGTAATVSIEKVTAKGGSIAAPENTINTVSITGDVTLSAPVQTVTAGNNAKLTLDNNVVIPTIEAEGDLTLEGSGTVTSIDVKNEKAATITSKSANVEVAQVTKTATNTNEITVSGLDVAVAKKAAKPENLEAVPPTDANGNGAIKGVTTKMEYKGGNVTAWTPISNVINDSMTLAPGTYQVRVKADTANKVLASEAVTVTVNKAVGVNKAEIQGTPYVGQTLTAVANADATDTLHYEWKAGDSVVGIDSKTLSLTNDMVGETITVKIYNYSGRNDGTVDATKEAQDTKTSVATKIVTADKTALKKLIDKASEVQRGISEGTTADAVAEGVRFVTNAEKTKLTDVVAAATLVANNDKAITDNVTAQETALRSAINTYENAIKTGTLNETEELRKALTTLISTAGEVKADITDSDAKNVTPGTPWVTEAVQSTYVTEITTAEGVKNSSSAGSADLSKAISDLSTAISTYIKAIQKGAALDNSALIAAINAANINAASVITTTANDGTDVLPSQTWVTATVKTDYTSAIETAKEIANTATDETTQSVYDSALGTLNTETDKFNNAKQAGKKDIVAPVITNVSATLNDGTATISFTTNEAGSYKTGDAEQYELMAAGTIFFDVQNATAGSVITVIVKDNSENATEFTVKLPENTANKVAKIGDEYYDTLAAAIAAVKDGETIKLMKNIKLSETAVVMKDLTIDLNGKTIEGTNTRAIHVKSGTLTLTGTGTVTSTGSMSIDGSVIRVGDGKTYEEKIGTPAGLVVDINVTISAPASYGVTAFGGDTTETVIIKGKVQATGYSSEKPYDGCAVATNGSDCNTPATITIENTAEITATQTNAIYMPAGKLEVKGGTIAGATGIYFKSTNMTISGGTITGNGAKADYQYYGNGGYSTGEAVTIDSCNYPGGINKIEITGGTFSSTNANAVGSYNSKDATLQTGFITGGTFSTDPSAYVAENHGALLKDGFYTVVSGYDTLEALAAEKGVTADFGYANTTSGEIVIDGGNAVVTKWVDAWVNSNTTIKNVTFANGAVFNVKQDNINVTLENCTFYACDQSRLTYTSNNSITNSGGGMCLNLENSAHIGNNFTVKNCTFVGENDKTLSAKSNKYKGDGSIEDPNKKRGHAIAFDAICGGGTGTLESLTIEGCTIDGVRGNAIQLYGTTGDITIKDTKINSWGVNKGDGNGSAIRGSFATSNYTRTLKIINVYFGLDENKNIKPEILHVEIGENIGDYSGNTDGTRTAGTYSYPENN